MVGFLVSAQERRIGSWWTWCAWRTVSSLSIGTSFRTKPREPPRKAVFRCSETSSLTNEQTAPSPRAPGPATWGKESVASRFQERQQVCVDGLGLRGGHTVWKALIGLQRPLLQELGGQRPCVGVGDDLVVIPVHHQDGNRDLLEIVGEVRLRERDDSIVVGLRAPHHPLTPPILDHA